MAAIGSIGDISAKLRRRIIRAAGGSGLTVDAWLEQALAQTAASCPPGPELGPRPEPELEPLLAAIDQCLAHIWCNRGNSADPGGHAASPSAAAPAKVIPLPGAPWRRALRP